MEVYLVRHTTPNIDKGLIYGRTDVPLSQDFESEKREVLSQLPEGIDYVLSSPSIRCTELARLISETYQTDERLFELDFGDLEGKTWDTINREESDFWMADFVNRHPPKGETMLQMQKRVLSVWESVLTSGYKKVAIVTHGGVIRIIRCMLENLPLKNAFTINVPFGEVFKVIM